MDYGIATLAGVPGYLLDRLQSVLHAAGCSTSGERLEQVQPRYFIAPGPSLVAGP